MTANRRAGGPQQRTLVRARDLAAFRAALVDRALAGGPLAARRRAVVVPTRAAGELLRQSIEAAIVERGQPGAFLPDLLTRDDLMRRLAEALPDRLPLAPRPDRLVMLERAARETAARPRMAGAPVPLRPGLVAAMLDFYDELHRRQRPVRRFARALFDQLRGERGVDRGTDSLIHQTCFLGFTFLAYERALRAAGRLDEHRLRRALLDAQPVLPFDHLVVAVADHPADPRGLWPADFDLVGRLYGLARLDVVTTDAVHDAGFRERVEQELPGIVEVRHEAPATVPVLRCPAGDTAGSDDIVFLAHDREEELRQVARVVRARARAGDAGRLERTAIVFQRPLPYLHLARQVLAEGGVPFQAFDALPLASEPYASLLDIVLGAARTRVSREAALELLRCRLLRFDVRGVEVSPPDVAALDEVLVARRVTGDAAAFVEAVDADARSRASSRAGGEARARRARRAALAAAAACEVLRPFHEARDAASQVRTVIDFLRRHERRPGAMDPAHLERHVRARAAVHDTLASLAGAYERHDNRPRSAEDLGAAIRQALESHTFAPRQGDGGVHLIDAVAARFGTFDHVHLVGLVETDWPERPRRNLFYTAGLLRSLGWPQEPDHARVQHALFEDLLALSARSLSLHAFQFDGDAIVAASPLVEIARGRPREVVDAPPPRLMFDDEILTVRPPLAIVGDPLRGAWLEARRSRPALSQPAYAGFIGRRDPRRYRVSRIDRYVECPFKYFAAHVLDLPDERDEVEGLTPLERGTLLHALFERFYREWDAEGRGAITPDTLPEAVARFAAMADEAIARLPEADRLLERARLLGSIVSPGVAERAFELEADCPDPIARRLIEQALTGTFRFPLLGGLRERLVEISGKVDRVDVFASGAIRVIDYKLGRLPDLAVSVQVAVYAHAVRQWLERLDGQSHPIDTAMYLAFGDEQRLEGPIGSRDEPAAIAVEARAGAFAAAVDRIEAGEYPARPRRVSECQWCPYAGVCRKEYWEGADEAADAL